MILSTFMTKRNWEQPSESKQLSSFLYLYHKIFWRTSFRIQAESFMVFPSFMLKTIEAGHSESKHFFFFSTFMTKAFEKRTTFWTETISLVLRFIPSVLKHYRPTKKDRFTVTNKNTSRHSSGHAFIHNPFFNLGFLSRIFTI